MPESLKIEVIRPYYESGHHGHWLKCNHCTYEWKTQDLVERASEFKPPNVECPNCLTLANVNNVIEEWRPRAARK